jgi:hypothetical protein
MPQAALAIPRTCKIQKPSTPSASLRHERRKILNHEPPRTVASRWGHHRQASLERLATDETLNAQSTPEAVPALAPSTHRFQLDLVDEEFPEHLASLRGVAAEERGHIAEPFSQRMSRIGYGPLVRSRLTTEQATV